MRLAGDPCFYGLQLMQQGRGAETPNVHLRVLRVLFQALESAARGEESCPEIHVRLSTVSETF